ncbi:MAG: hypothetical protein K9J12_12975 [Melioribacteraceae bacterium]|nr:hypothetical protein [Melioribacteraceae bacterium]MCF8266106.1 hypothetical protein [Melioribacteraceae bacterium]MCF8430828.1 hypothetical protein [Melioribacteraceae bacterium]
MINQNEFYSKNDEPKKYSKFRVWRKIRSEIRSTKSKRMELRSFALGFATALLAIFAFAGVFNLYTQLTIERLPQQVKINNAYKSAIDEFEKILPVKSFDPNQDVDLVLASQLEKMNDINTAINTIKNERNDRDFSKINMQRLRLLYKMKLETIEQIIKIEEGGK